MFLYVKQHYLLTLINYNTPKEPKTHKRTITTWDKHQLLIKIANTQNYKINMTFTRQSNDQCNLLHKKSRKNTLHSNELYHLQTKADESFRLYHINACTIERWATDHIIQKYAQPLKQIHQKNWALLWSSQTLTKKYFRWQSCNPLRLNAKSNIIQLSGH